MNRLVGSVGHQIPFRSENGAGEIQSLFDICGNGGALQNTTHLLGDGHEPGTEQRQLHRIKLRTDRPDWQCFHFYFDIAKGCHRCPAGRFYQDG